MKNNIAKYILFISVIVLSGCTYYAPIEDIAYLNGIHRVNFTKMEEQKLNRMKYSTLDFLNKFSDYKIQIVSDTLISTYGPNGETKSNNCKIAKYGYKITIHRDTTNKYSVTAICFTNKFGSKRVAMQNERMLIYYILTGELREKYINNSKTIIYYGPRYGPWDD